MIQLFKKSTFFGILLLLPYAFVLHLGLFLQRKPEISYAKDWFYQYILGKWSLSYEWQTILSALLIGIQAIIIARVSNKLKLVPEGQLFPSIIYIVLCGLHPDHMRWGPILLANTFLIFAILYIMNLNNKKSAAVALFNFGFFVGVASLLYIPYYLFLLIGIVAIIILRGFSIREVFQMIFGFGNVWLLWYMWLIYHHEIEMFNQAQLYAYFEPFIFSMKFTKAGWIAFGLLFLLTLICIFYYQSFQVKKGILLQKQFDILFWLLLISFFTTLFQQITQIQHHLLLITPLSFLLANLLQRIKNPLFLETIHFGFGILALFLQLQNW